MTPTILASPVMSGTRGMVPITLHPWALGMGIYKMTNDNGFDRLV